MAIAAVMVWTVSGCKGSKQGDPDPVDDSPVVHSPLSNKAPKGCGSYSWHYGEAWQTLQETEDFRPGKRDYYVRERNDHRNEFLLAGISPGFRKDWFESHKTAEKDRHCMVEVFDAIGAAAKKTLPNYQPRGYTHHESGEDDLIKAAVKEELKDAEFLDVGVSSPSWNIEKHSNGIPSDRYKYGMAWVKAPSLDDGYCRIAYVNIVQDYAGGESYADSVANFIKFEPAGCK